MSYRTADGTRVNAKTGSPRKPDGRRERQGYKPPKLANPGNVIDCAAEEEAGLVVNCGAVGGGRMGSPLAHKNEAPFPEKLVDFFVRSFCPPGGLALDPFCGSGTTLAVAVRHGRRAFGCDLRASQVELTRRRLAPQPQEVAL
jgi:DNA modification methylase